MATTVDLRKQPSKPKKKERWTLSPEGVRGELTLTDTRTGAIRRIKFSKETLAALS